MRIAVDRYLAVKLAALHEPPPDKDKGPSWRAIEKMFDGKGPGISHVSAMKIAKGVQPVGPDIELAWAAKYHRGDVGELRRAAEAWAKEEGLWGIEAVALPAGAWLDELPLRHVRMRPALDMAIDAGASEDTIRRFVQRHEDDPRDHSSSQWWTILQAEWAQEEDPPSARVPAHRVLRDLAQRMTAAGDFVPESVVSALAARYDSEPAEGWSVAIGRERMRQGREHLQADIGRKREERQNHSRAQSAAAPARRRASAGKKAAR